MEAQVQKLKPESFCCRGYIDSHRSPLGEMFFWCKTCQRELNEDGSDNTPKNRDERDFRYSPLRDYYRGLDFIESYVSYLHESTHRSQSYTPRDLILHQREAFKWGARYVPAKNATEDELEAQAQELYPFLGPNT